MRRMETSVLRDTTVHKPVLMPYHALKEPTTTGMGRIMSPHVFHVQLACTVQEQVEHCLMVTVMSAGIVQKVQLFHSLLANNVWQGICVRRAVPLRHLAHLVTISLLLDKGLVQSVLLVSFFYRFFLFKDWLKLKHCGKLYMFELKIRYLMKSESEDKIGMYHSFR